MLVALAFICGGNTAAPGQNRADTGNPAEAGPQANSETALAKVVVDGDALFSVRGVSAYPAERRAREIADRIRALAENPKFAPASIKVEEGSAATWI